MWPVVQLDETLGQREADPETAARAIRVLIDWTNMSKMRGRDSARCLFRCRSPSPPPGRIDGRRHPDVAASLGVFHGVFSRLDERLRQPREVAFAPRAERPRQLRRQHMGSGVSDRLDGFDRAAKDGSKVDPVALSSIALRVMRDMSRTSSVSRTS